MTKNTITTIEGLAALINETMASKEDIKEFRAEVKQKFHIPSDLVVACVTAQRKPPDVRIGRLRNQSCVGNRPPSTATPH
jgi:hypothetical protein